MFSICFMSGKLKTSTIPLLPSCLLSALPLFLLSSSPFSSPQAVWAWRSVSTQTSWHWSGGLVQDQQLDGGSCGGGHQAGFENGDRLSWSVCSGGDWTQPNQALLGRNDSESLYGTLPNLPPPAYSTWNQHGPDYFFCWFLDMLCQLFVPMSLSYTFDFIPCQ